ncbi:hypothetical protein [Longimicrobium sp.]|uniref:hypothetical protein n=1 Tax=Longimicrobium sp. TaxID=2029185 RepID=UPI002E32D652|nr:hypothetical protein [Longimicrobium sp.]HEX6038891.1 hypothetical protein [Longimicrobium sp.]
MPRAEKSESERRLVFCYWLWQPLGDCREHQRNECFFLPATVVRRYWRARDGADDLERCDVVFDAFPDYVSKGHFYTNTLEGR